MNYSLICKIAVDIISLRYDPYKKPYKSPYEKLKEKTPFKRDAPERDRNQNIKIDYDMAINKITRIWNNRYRRILEPLIAGLNGRRFTNEEMKNEDIRLFQRDVKNILNDAVIPTGEVFVGNFRRFMRNLTGYDWKVNTATFDTRSEIGILAKKKIINYVCTGIS